MFRGISEYDFVRTMLLMRSKFRGYLMATIFERTVNAFFLNTIRAFILKDVLDGAIKGDMSLMFRALLLASSAFLVGIPVVSVFYYIINRYAREAMTDIRMRLFRHLAYWQMGSFEQHHSGDLISRMTNDLEAMEELYIKHVQPLVMVIILGLISLIVIFSLDWRFGVVILLLGLLTFWVNAIFAKPLRWLSDLIQQEKGESTERLMDLLQGLSEAKIFHAESLIHQAYAQKNEHISITTVKHGHLTGLFGMTDYLLGNVRTIGLLSLGLFMLLKGYAIEVGTIAAIVQLDGQAKHMFTSISTYVPRIQHALAGASRVLELLDTPVEPEKHTVSARAAVSIAKPPNNAIDVRHVTFGYATNETIVLDHVTISVAPGQTAALVGPSGGGKSTLLKLLLGFYPPHGGAILINGIPIEYYSLPQLREQMAYVSQDAYLFDGTIEENIRYGKPEATTEQIIAAAKAANAHDFILAQPNHYKTQVGERGAKLSGGQRQRIAIARALLKNAPVLLLDEATSALDSESEQLVQEALGGLMQGRTTIAIAHRLSTINHADVIYVLDGGKVVEQGRHEDLIGNRRLYKRLHESQFRKNETAILI